MSKKNKEFMPQIGYEGAYLIHDWSIKNLEGRLLTMVESWGLKDTQEKSVKDLVRQEVWSLITPCFYVGGEDVTALHEKYPNNTQVGGTPRSN